MESDCNKVYRAENLRMEFLNPDRLINPEIRAKNFRIVDIGIYALSSLFDNLKINIILQDYLKSV